MLYLIFFSTWNYKWNSKAEPGCTPSTPSRYDDNDNAGRPIYTFTCRIPGTPRWLLWTMREWVQVYVRGPPSFRLLHLHIIPFEKIKSLHFRQCAICFSCTTGKSRFYYELDAPSLWLSLSLSGYVTVAVSESWCIFLNVLVEIAKPSLYSIHPAAARNTPKTHSI